MRENPTATVCIPAYNEAANIGLLLRDLKHNHAKFVDEILVCANGCEDGTESIVARFAQSDASIKLLTAPLGKPHAWNALVRTAKNDILVFVDADLALGKKAVDVLVEHLYNSSQCICVSGINLPSPFPISSKHLLAGLASLPLTFDYLYGGLYAFYKSRLKKRMLKMGLSKQTMPVEVIAEDYFLEQIAGKDGFAVERRARAYFEPGTLTDVIKARVRLEVARRQIKANWAWGDERPLYSRVKEKLLSPAPLAEKLFGLGGTMVRNILLMLWSAEADAYRRAMQRDVSENRGGTVLATSGRLSVKQERHER